MSATQEIELKPDMPIMCDLERAKILTVWNDGTVDVKTDAGEIYLDVDRGLITVIEAECEKCHSMENLRDSEECWACYDMRRHDAEMLSRHGGDV